MASVHSAETSIVGSSHYCIVPSEQLPSLNPSICIRHRVFSRSQAARYDRSIHRIQIWMMPLYVAVLLLRALVVFVDAPLGRKLAPVAFFLQLPLLAVFMMSLSLEFIQMLAFMLDFWLHSLAIGLWVVCLGLSFNDARAFILPGCWMDCINAVLVEAYLHARPSSLGVLIVAANVLLGLMTAVSLDLIQDAQYEAHVTPRRASVSTKDLMLNALGTTFMLLVRIVYRKREALRQQRRSDTPGLHHSLSYLCRLKLQRHNVSFHAVGSVVEDEMEERATTRTSSLQQPRLRMRFVKLQTTIDPRQTLVPAVANLTMKMQRYHAYSLHVVGVFSLLLSTLAFINNETHWVGTAALTATLVFVGWFLGCLHRKLLYQLFTSFDFAFLYLQLLAAHVCICDLIDWEWTRSCAVVSGHLWMLWALTLDALMPGLRRRLRLRIAASMLIVAICLLAKVLLTVELLCWTHWRIQDNVLLDLRVLGRRLDFHVQSFLISRFLTIFAWCSRLLWRLGTRQDENELVMLLGRVEYNYRDWKAQSRKWTLSSTQILTSTPPAKAGAS